MPSRLFRIAFFRIANEFFPTAQEAASGPVDIPAGDWKPSSINQKGKEYPQVNSERRARFRVVAPEAERLS